LGIGFGALAYWETEKPTWGGYKETPSYYTKQGEFEGMRTPGVSLPYTVFLFVGLGGPKVQSPPADGRSNGKCGEISDALYKITKQDSYAENKKWLALIPQYTTVSSTFHIDVKRKQLPISSHARIVTAIERDFDTSTRVHS
jgi:hypothetical protein